MMSGDGAGGKVMGTVRGGGRGEAGGVDATVETIDDDAESLDDDEYSESATVPTEWRAGCNWISREVAEKIVKNNFAKSVIFYEKFEFFLNF